jgi:WD40 repeat protein
VGEPPFRRKSDVAVLFEHLEAEPPAASATRPELPAALDAVIARALAKDPEQRYRSCRELARAALAVTVDEASRLLADVAARAAAGRRDLGEVEAELAGKVVDLQLVREQARVLAGTPTPARVAAEGVCPFKGLASFEPADADYFFGRERLIAELVARLVGASFLGIVGPSGSGKSSVLRAGLLPALAGGVLPGSERWRRVLMRPGERPVEELRRVLMSSARDPLAEATRGLGPEERLLLAVDQLEELFTACADERQRTGFVDMLARAVADPDGRAIVVVAVRADFYGRFAAFPSLAEPLGANHLLVGSMQPSELRRAIELPASRVGLRVEPELTDALVDDVEGEPGTLPLLSTSLLELWQKRQDNTLALAAYRESGGVQGAVARLAEGTYARIPEERKPLVRALMLRLVGEGEGDTAVRRRAPLAELDLERNREAEEVLAILADSRLVTVSEGSVEVAHEALLREWPRLAEWIEEDAEDRRLRRHITQAATEWDEADRDQAELYRGARLAAALDWSADHALELNELERQFMGESREASEKETKRVRKTNRRLRGLLIGVAVLLAAAIAGGIFAVLQRGEARDAAAEARNSAAQARGAETAQLAQRLGAQALVEEDLDLSLLLARQAVAIDDTPQTRGSLLATLLRAPAATGIMHGSDEALLVSIARSPDGRTLAVIDFYGKLHFFDPRTYEQIGEPLPLRGWVESIAYSPDGETLAIGGEDGYVRLIDARTREELARVVVGPHAARLAYTDNGSRLVVFSAGSLPVISIRDASTLEPVGIAIEPEGFRASNTAWYLRPPHFALTPDGRSLVTASDDGELAWWDLQSRRKTRALEIAKGYHALALSPDGLTAAVGIDGGIQLVDLRTGDAITASAGFTGSPNWVRFSPDGKTVVSANLDGTLTLWEVGSTRQWETLRGHSKAVEQAVFSADGDTLYTVSGDGTAVAWDLTRNRSVARPFTFTHDRDFQVDYDAHPGVFSPDSRLIGVGLKEQGIQLLDARKLTPAGAPLLETGGEVKALAFSPNGQTLAAVTGHGQATIWDLASHTLRHEPFLAPGGERVGVAFSPAGTTLATVGTSGVVIWDVATGARLTKLTTLFGLAQGVGVAFSADGARVAFAQWRGAQVWDVAKESLVATVGVAGGTGTAGAGALGSTDLLSVALSPDGEMLAVGGYGRLVRLSDIGTGKLLHELDVGGSGAATLEFSPDGRTLAVSGRQANASLWDVATGTRIGPSLTAGLRWAMLDLSADGRRLLLTSANGHGAVWDIDPQSWNQRACELANRTLTEEEWELFLPGRPYEPACA